MCLRCHEEVIDAYPVMHGPVAGVACLWCHAPHDSTVEPLLRTQAPDLCLQCHGLELTTTPQPPEHHDLERDCLACHGGHGGDNAYFVIGDTDRQEGLPQTIGPADAGEQ